MTGRSWAFIIGSGRSGTTLLSEILNQSSRVFIAPETKYFQQVWSQRHLLALLPKENRVQAVVNHLVNREYPARPPVFGPHRLAMEQALRQAPDLERGFLALLETLSERPVLGEKTPWHAFFVDRILRMAPQARFVAIVRDAPATVASLWRRQGFRRVETLTQCIARWLVFHEEILALDARLDRERFHVLRFEDLIRTPEAELRETCGFLGIPFEEQMLVPSWQDSSLRGGGGSLDVSGFDTGALDRWRQALTAKQVRRVRAHTWRASGMLGYVDEEGVGGEGRSVPDPSTPDRLRVSLEARLLRAGIQTMRSGFYPFGAATSTFVGRSSSG